MKVTLTKELETLVKEKVRSGRYADKSDVVRDALKVDLALTGLSSKAPRFG